MRTIRAIGERGLIERLRRRLGRSPSVLVGIGDDAAALRAPQGRALLLASDMLVEGVHFRRGVVPARWIGWKALAVNVSDIAAMGGRPHWAVVSLGLPPATPVRFVDELYAGLECCAQHFGVSIVGGDTDRAPRVVIDVAIVGSADPRRVVRRSGARVGDSIFVTGRLGGSYASGRHARFIPRLTEAHALLQRVRVHAMIDLSDGLAADLWQLSRASRVVLRVEAATIPVSRAAKTCLRRACICRLRRGRQALHHALMDGEDFELLFTVDERASGRVPRRIGACPVTRIGRVMRRGEGAELIHADGRLELLSHTGFQHF